MESMRLGPPFLGITDNPFDTSGRCLLAMNYLCRVDRLQRRPGWSEILPLTQSNLGIRGFGDKRGRSILVTVGHTNGVVNVTLTTNDGSVGTDVTSFYGATVKGPVTFASMYGKLYIAGAGPILVVDPDDLSVKPLVMTTGTASLSRTYLAEPPPARVICSHLGRMFYAAMEGADLLVYGTTTGDQAYVDDTSWISDTYHVSYKPWHILYSESAHPERVQSLSNFALQDDGYPITAIHPFRGGLVILTTGGTWFLSGTGEDNFRIDKIGSVGCLAPASVSSDNDAMYWLAPDGIYWMGSDLTPQAVGGLDWLWNGDTPLFAALLGSNTRVFPRLRLGIYSDAVRSEATGVYDRKQGGYLLTRVLYNSDPRVATPGDTYDVGIFVDGATKTASMVAPCPSILGSGGNTDIGSVISDVLGGYGASIYAWNAGEYRDGGVWASRVTVNMPAQYVSTFREASPAYLNISGIRVFSAPQALDVFPLSWERLADWNTPAGGNTDAKGDGSTAPDVWGDTTLINRWVPDAATSGNRWLAAGATSGIRWGTEIPGVFKADVVGHGKAVAVSITDAQLSGSSPILQVAMDADGEGNS